MEQDGTWSVCPIAACNRCVSYCRMLASIPSALVLLSLPLLCFVILDGLWREPFEGFVLIDPVLPSRMAVTNASLAAPLKPLPRVPLALSGMFCRISSLGLSSLGPSSLGRSCLALGRVDRRSTRRARRRVWKTAGRYRSANLVKMGLCGNRNKMAANPTCIEGRIPVCAAGASAYLSLPTHGTNSFAPSCSSKALTTARPAIACVTCTTRTACKACQARRALVGLKSDELRHQLRLLLPKLPLVLGNSFHELVVCLEITLERGHDLLIVAFRIIFLEFALVAVAVDPSILTHGCVYVCERCTDTHIECIIFSYLCMLVSRTHKMSVRAPIFHFPAKNSAFSPHHSTVSAESPESPAPED